MRTAKRLGVKTVAVFSEADRDALFVKTADEAYLIGPAASADSYLRMDKILDVAKRSNAQAIHPGYGFLSENSSFADAVEKAGLTFIGPPSQAIIDMGSKSASKEIMINAGVPVVPGYHGENQEPAFLKSEADKMGYPVLIKAVKGGGGKGMRIVEKQEDFYEMLESSRREAIKSLETMRSLLKMFADKLGNAVYLFERDCSVQRRHQKVLEEAPAPGLSPELRASLGAKAVAAAKAVNYNTSQFYFMEMNTRLQVEHPITEMITNTDLVEWQLQVASGNPVPKLQKDLAIDGWSFEARIYAESPDKTTFMPDTGPLLRIETGVQQGDVVSVHYDPMISKLVVKGSDRTEALRVLRKALGEFEVVGLNTNIEFLKRLASHPGKHYNDLFPPKPATPPTTLAHAALSLYSSLLPGASFESTDPWSLAPVSGFRMNGSQGSTKTFTFVQDKTKETKVLVSTTRDGQGSYNILVTDPEGKSTAFESVRVLDYRKDDGGYIVADIGDQRVKGRVVKEGVDKVHVFSHGLKTTVSGAHAAVGSVKTPMPCKISSVSVKAGDKVVKGQNLIVLEAMKMEHVIKSPKDGVIKRVHYSLGEIVGEGKVLVTFEDE
ncbi:hypothetical protein BDR26DRAFT_874718 [Obelidium mucronatum]|nr:hypothetical protein BDR26DRAFT_874718 [Obelidium mucronatum]